MIDLIGGVESGRRSLRTKRLCVMLMAVHMFNTRAAGGRESAVKSVLSIRPQSSHCGRFGASQSKRQRVASPPALCLILTGVVIQDLDTAFDWPQQHE